MTVLLTAGFAGFVFFFILILFRKQLAAEKYKNDQIRNLKNEVKYLDEELEKSFYQRFIQPTFKKLAHGLSIIASRMTKKSGKKKSAHAVLDAQLKKAGIKMGASEYRLILVFFNCAILVGGGLLAFSVTDDFKIQILLFLTAFLAMLTIPRYYLKARIKKRTDTIQNDLPNVMDMLSLSIEAGLGFDAAVIRACSKLEGPLIDELSQMAREIQMGRSRRDALTALGERNDVKELQMFASAVIQSEQFGTPIKNVLASQAKQLRTSRKQRAQEKGMKAPIKMTLPMVIFIFPVIFIILLGPTVINIVQEFM